MIQRLDDLLSTGWPFELVSLVKSSSFLSRVIRSALRLYLTATNAVPNYHAQLRQMEPAPPPSEGKRVLIFSLRGWPIHLGWETTIARALHLRNAQTTTILCDRILPACEPRTSVDDFESTCERCVSESSRILAATGLPHRWLSEFVTPDEVNTFRQQVADLSLEELKNFTAKGMAIGELVAPSTNRHLLRGQIDPIPEHVEAYRRFVAAGLAIRAAAEKLLDELRPEVVLVMNGLFYAEAILMMMANARGIPVWSYERSHKVDHLIFAQNRAAVKADFDDMWEEWADKPLSPEQASKLDDYLKKRAAGEVGIYRLLPETQILDSTGSKVPTAALFTNVLWDTSVYLSDIGFDSMADWVIHTIRWFEAHPEWRLIVRVHPAETRVAFKPSCDPILERINQAMPTLPPNVRVIPPESAISSYGLMESADATLVYTSTVGMESAVRGTPTVVAGRIHYRDKGFTLDPDTPEAYDTVLLEVLSGRRMTENEIELARRYVYHFFFTEMIPFDLVHEGPRFYMTFNYRSNDDLRPGQNAALDAICEALLSGNRLVNPFAM